MQAESINGYDPLSHDIRNPRKKEVLMGVRKIKNAANIGLVKSDGRLDCNPLKGALGVATPVTASTCC